MHPGIPMKSISRSLKLWVYADVDTATNGVWGELLLIGSPDNLYYVSSLSQFIGDNASMHSAETVANWRRSGGVICHTRFDVTLQPKVGFWGSLDSISAAVRANPEGSNTSSFEVSSSKTTHLFDGSSDAHLVRVVTFAACLFAGAFEHAGIKYRIVES